MSIDTICQCGSYRRDCGHQSDYEGLRSERDRLRAENKRLREVLQDIGELSISTDARGPNQEALRLQAMAREALAGKGGGGDEGA